MVCKVRDEMSQYFRTPRTETESTLDLSVTRDSALWRRSLADQEHPIPAVRTDEKCQRGR
jgi:hypothetical protein